MAYTNVWDETLPTGSEAANTIDDIIRALKVDIDQRFVDIFGMPNFTADPLRPYVLKFADASDATINLGDNAGTPRTLFVKDKAGTNTFLQIAGVLNSATGLKITTAAAGAGLAIAVISSGANENLTIDAKGSGAINIGSVSTGGITLSRAVTVSTGGIAVTGNSTVTGTLTLSNALTINLSSTNSIILQSATSNQSILQFGVIPGTETFIQSTSSGAGVTRPLSIYIGGSVVTQITTTGATVTGTFHVTSTSALNGAVTIGSTASLNIVYDTNSIQAYNVAATSTLYINHVGGDVRIDGGGAFVVTGASTFAGISATTLALSGDIGMTGGDRIIGPTSNNTLSLRANNTSYFTVCANGGPANASQGNFFLANASAAPSGTPAGGGFLWVEAGALKFRGSGGTTTTLAAP